MISRFTELRTKIPPSTRSMGVHIVAGKGSGKSRLMGRLIAYNDVTSPKPVAVVIIDPHGITIDNLLDKLGRSSKEVQQQVAPRLRYYDFSGRLGYVPQFPLYYRLPGDTLSQVASRFPALLTKLDPYQSVAPVVGQVAIEGIGSSLGQVLVELGLTIADAPSLLSHPKDWLSRLSQIRGEAEVAARYFMHDYAGNREEERRASTLKGKIRHFCEDTILKKMYATTQASINWEEVVKDSLVVLLDFREVDDPRFKMIWALNTFLEYVKYRGEDREHPISLIIDELAYILALSTSDRDLLVGDLEELINKTARNNSVWLTLAHQEMTENQVPKRLRPTLMSMGNHIIGALSEPATALDFAQRFDPYNAYWEHHTDKVWMNVENGFRTSSPMPIDERPIYHTAPHQQIINSQKYLELKPFEFLVAACLKEGSRPTSVRKINIKKLDERQFPDPDDIKEFRSQLASLVRLNGSVPVNLLPFKPRDQFLADTSPPVEQRLKRATDSGQAKNPFFD